MRTYRTKAQSAMEYLMTYGWAILIIAVVLGALFSLGVFGSGNLLGTACIAQSGYLCSNPTLTAAGALTFTYGQNTGSEQYDTWLACTATQASTGGPNPQTYGSPGWQGFTGNSLISGQSTPVTINCASATGAVFTGSIGQSYTGTIWSEYSTTSGGAPSIIAQVATLSVKVS